MTRPFLVVVGPTCTGKTALAARLARCFAAAELISADSRQLRRGLRVATCAPGHADLDGVPCHLIDLADPGEPFSVARWLECARETLSDLERRGVVPIVVGGTGLYVSALVDGFDFGRTPPDHQTRERRTRCAASPDGLATLTAELLERDPSAANTVELRNPRRVVRALEILDRRPGPLRPPAAANRSPR
jgi:tRNA dimethylallyltransferase